MEKYISSLISSCWLAERGLETLGYDRGQENGLATDQEKKEKTA